jgi:hypothetical protein
MSAMGSSRLWGKITVLIAVCGWCLSAQAKYDGGSGTEAEPYRIRQVSDWQDLMATPADWASHFILTSDIDLNDVPITPVGNSTNLFTGVFDGNDNVIRNADVNMPDCNYVGLFGYLAGTIKNLGVEDVSIVGRDYVGGLVGYNGFFGCDIGGCEMYPGCNDGAISDCYSSGSVSGDEDVGGLVGLNAYGASISNCYSTASVSGNDDVGGLVGENYGTMSNCYSTGSVSASGWVVGGLVGYNGFFGCEMYPGFIYKCYSTGRVSRGMGLVGGNDYGGEVADSFWDTETSGQSASSGGTPKTTAEMMTQTTFTSAEWDFVEVWDIGENQTYPFIRTYAAGDIDHDATVDFRDVAHLAESWLR